uniref:type VI secretion system Vgr family protein n=1 Tax=Aquabacterium sp. TaxID=1872578 RepID=UPI0027B94046
MALPGSLGNAVASVAGAALSSVSAAAHSFVEGTLGALLRQWVTDTRLYNLESASRERALPVDLMVESFVLHDAVSEPFSLYLNTLVLDAHVELKQLYARPVTLLTTLADGSQARRSGYVTEAWSLQSDGGLARKALLVRPWIALLGHSLQSRIWQDKSVMEIVEDVLADHASIAAWHWDEDVPAYIAQGLCARNEGRRSYCVQYRESDLAFLQRLLAEEGIAWRVEEDEAAPGGHRVVFFVDSSRQPEDATSQTSLGGRGIRFHGSSSQEAQDSIQALAALRQLGPTATMVQGWDYQANAAITAEVPTAHSWGGDEATSLQSWLSSYDPSGDFIWGNSAEAQFAATRLQEALEARYKSWLGRGTVRTLRAGTWATVTQSTLDPLTQFGQAEGDKDFFFTQVHALGINNLPKDLSDAIARTLGDAELPVELGAQAASEPGTGTDAATDAALDTQALRERAARTGYACQFQALRRKVPWRAVLLDDTGSRPRPRPTALGPQTAIVVGPQGQTQPQGADELYTDRLGRIKVKFHWQANPFAPQRANSDHSCWVRVVQRAATAGGGHQFIPRIGQEVLVGFLGNDIDRPL